MTTSLYRPARTELRLLSRLALPIALAQTGAVLLTLVDTAIVGRVSVDELAGVALGRSILFSATTIGMGVGYGLEPLAAQALGAGKPEAAWGALVGTLRAVAIVGPLTIAATLLVTLALPLAGVEPAVVASTRAFLVGHAPGTFAFITFIAAKSFLQAHHQPRSYLVASIVANLLNVVACSLLVRGDDALAWVGLPALGLPTLGAFGAGISASIAYVTMAAIILYAASRYRPTTPVIAPPTRRILKLALPIGLQFFSEIGVASFVGVLAAGFGPHVVSAHQIALGLATFTLMGALGVAGATAVRVGHAVGAGHSPRQVGFLGIGLGACVMLASALVFALFPAPLLGLFTSDRDVLAAGVPLLQIAAVFQLFDGVQSVAAGALRGAGDVRYSFVANAVAHWLVGLPAALVLAFVVGLGARGLWYGLTLGLVVIAVALTRRFVQVSARRIARIELEELP